MQLPTVDFFGTQVTRLILGDNPCNGHSYIPDLVTGDEMMDYYTGQRVVDALFEAESAGYNTCLPLATPFMLRAFRQFRNEGGRMHIIFQPYTPIPLEVNLRMMLACDPIAIYHQGTTTDYLIETGNIAALRENLRLLRDTGLPVGFGTHVPEHVLRAEEEGWGVDFYLTCLYNARRNRLGEQSGFITGKTKSNLVFCPEDRFRMFEVIRGVQKPCIAFKLLAGGQVFIGKQPSEYPQVVKDTLREVYESIKPTDLGVIGAFQRDGNQIRENAELLHTLLH